LRAPGDQLRHVDLHRGIVGERLQLRELGFEPIFDRGLAAVGDDAHADLPAGHVALALGGDEPQHEHHGRDRDRGQQQQPEHEPEAGPPPRLRRLWIDHPHRQPPSANSGDMFAVR